ncbi:preprotein translocase subunit YajC [Acinetobacter sp. MD2]|nr:preprotein translocase subunit YajC [Acinetobacter sp. MD2]MEB3768224.1 preprotein translocase subunit YajC [Acinetobacter sp. MD2]
MFEHLSANYTLGLIAYVATSAFMCLPIAYLIYKLRKEQRK